MTAYYVYRCFAQDDQLLYIGITNDLARRFAQHKQGSAWYSQMARNDHETVNSQDEARGRERELIATLKPLHNRALNRETKKAFSIRLSDVAYDLIDSAQAKYGVAATAVIEIAIRKLASVEGVGDGFP